MRKCILIIICGFLISSCEQNLDVLAPPEFIPVVYCLLDPSSEIQTLRISRVFQDQGDFQSWHSYDAADLDSGSFIAYIEHLDSVGNKRIRNFSFKENSDSKQTAEFAQSHIYETRFKPKPLEEYHIYVYFPILKKMVSASTVVVPDVTIIDPAIVPERKVVILPGEPFTLRWSSGMSTSYFQGFFKINFLEKELSEIRSKSIDIQMRPRLDNPNAGFYSQNLTIDRLLNEIKSGTDIRKDVSRKIVSIDFTLYYGGEELAIYTHSGINPSGSSGVSVNYSNLDNGYGLFSSLTMATVQSLLLAEQTIDVIATNALTQSLNFLRHDEDF